MRFQDKVYALFLVWEIFASHSTAMGIAPNAWEVRSPAGKSVQNTEIKPDIPPLIQAKTACYGRVVPEFEAASEDDYSRGDPKPFIASTDAQVATYDHQLCMEKIGQAKTGDMWMRRSIESVQLKNGHTFVADTMGWDAMGTRYTFVLPGESRPFTDQTYWQNKAIDLLQEIGGLIHNSDERSMLDEGVQYLYEKVRSRAKRKGAASRFSAASFPTSQEPNDVDSGTSSSESMVRVLWAEHGKLPTGGSWFQVVVAGGSI